MIIRLMAKKWVRVALSLAIWFVLLAFLVRAVDRLPAASEWADAWQAGLGGSALAFGLAFTGAFVLRGVRFGLQVRDLHLVSWKFILRDYPWLAMLGAITPFRLGEAYRAVWMRGQRGRASDAIGLLVGERVTDLVLLLMIFGAGLGLAPSQDFAVLRYALVLLPAGIAAYVAMVLVSPALARRLEKASDRTSSLVRMLDALAYLRHPVRHARMLGISLAIWALMILAFYTALEPLGMSRGDTIAAAMACLAAVNLAGLLSGAPGNFGGFHASMLAVMLVYGQPVETVLMIAVIIQGVGLGLMVLYGSLARLTKLILPA